MEVGQLFAAKETFFDHIKVADDSSRKRPLVYARTAFATAFRRYAGPSKMGKVLGRNHASIVHYHKSHNELIKYDDYAKIYKYATEYRDALLQGEDLPFMDIESLIEVIKDLRTQLRLEQEKVAKMYIYKEKIEALKNLI